MAIAAKPPEVSEMPKSVSAAAPAPIARPMPTTGLALAGVTVLGIWVCVLIASAYSPDLVTGYYHEHHPLAAYMDWIFGLLATTFVVQAALQGVRARAASLVPWIGLSVGVTAVWIVVALASVFSPVSVTGTDPTMLPMSVIGAPIIGVFLSWFVCSVTKTLFEEYRS